MDFADTAGKIHMVIRQYAGKTLYNGAHFKRINSFSHKDFLIIAAGRVLGAGKVCLRPKENRLQIYCEGMAGTAPWMPSTSQVMQYVHAV